MLIYTHIYIHTHICTGRFQVGGVIDGVQFNALVNIVNYVLAATFSEKEVRYTYTHAYPTLCPSFIIPILFSFSTHPRAGLLVFMPTSLYLFLFSRAFLFLHTSAYVAYCLSLSIEPCAPS